MEVGEDGRAGMPELVDALAEDDAAAGEHEDADEEPDGERLLGAGIDVGGWSLAGSLGAWCENEQMLRTSKDEMRGSSTSLRSGRDDGSLRCSGRDNGVKTGYQSQRLRRKRTVATRMAQKMGFSKRLREPSWGMMVEP